MLSGSWKRAYSSAGPQDRRVLRLALYQLASQLLIVAGVALIVAR